MKVLYYDWNSNSGADICQGFSNLNIEYDIWKKSLENYESDEIFLKSLREQLYVGNYDCIFSFDYIPLISYGAQKCGILYYSWVYDCPQFTLFSDSVYNSCNRIFVFDRNQYYYFVNRGVKNIFHLPLAVNVHKFEWLFNEEDAANNNIEVQYRNLKSISYLHEVSFIGNLYNNNMYNQINYLPPYMKGYLDGIISSQLNVYGYNLFTELLTKDIVNELNKYIKLDDSVNIKLPNEVIYEKMLSDKLAEIERIEVLTRCCKYADVLLCTGSDASKLLNDTSKIGKINVRPPVDYDTELPALYRKTKINLNITCRSISSGMPMRVLDVMGCGGFLLSNYQTELAEYFVPGEEVVLYESMADLEDKVSYYLSHDDERISIAQRRCEKVRKYFSYENMLRKMFSEE